MSCGTNTVESTSSPPAAYLNAYSNVLGQAQNVAAQPLTQYPGQIVQGFSPDQTNAFNTVAGASQPIAQAGSTVAGAAGAANPYLSQAQTNLTAATAPLWNGVQQFSPQAVSQYESPYTSQVVNATQAEFNNQNQQQSNALNGSAAAAGAFGGDRTAVAQAQLAGQQQLAQAPTIANMENQGYSTALGEFNTQQQSQLQANEADSWLNSQAGFGEMNLGQEAQNLPLTEAQAQLGIGSAQLNQASAQLQTGGLEQQLGQENLNVPYEEFLQQQAYPFQTTNYLAGIAEGAGSAAGGTSSTTSPGASIGSQLGGLGTSGLALNNLGAFNGLGSIFGSAGLDTAAASASTAGAADTLYAASSAALPGAADAGASLLDLLAAAARGGRIRPRANGGNVIPFRRGGMVPVRRDAGGMLPYQQIPVTPDIPNVSVQFVPEVNQTRGMGIPRAPGASPQQDQFDSQQLSQISNLLKNSGTTTTTTMQRGGKVRRYADGGMADDGDDDVPMPIPRPSLPSDPVAQPAVGMTPQNYGFTAPTPITLNPQKADPNMALLAAGLGMLGGTSPHPLQNIGRGAMLGLQEYQQNKQQNETDAEKQTNVQEENQKNTLSYQDAVTRAKQMADDLERRRDQMKQSEQFHEDQTNYQSGELKLRQGELGNQEAGTWSYVGIDPTTQNPIMLNNRTGQTKIGEAPIGAKPGADSGMGGGGRYAGQATRSLVAGRDVTSDLENLSSLPVADTTGWFGMRSGTSDGSLMHSAFNVLGNKMTTQGAQDLNATGVGLARGLAGLEAGGTASAGGKALMDQYEKLLPAEGDTGVTAMRKLGTMRQNALNGIEANMASPYITKDQKQLYQNAYDRIERAIPWTPADVTRYEVAAQKNGGLTFGDYAKQNHIGAPLQTIKTPGDAAKLPSGTHFLDPNGTERIAP